MNGTQPLPSGLLRRASGGGRAPGYVIWEVTLRCDQACRFCGSRAGAARPDELDTREALDVVTQLAELGVREVALHGGEAYLRGDWLDIVRAIRSHGMLPTLVTGGRGLTAELARAAAAAGLHAASLSIDGTAAMHDGLRATPRSHAGALAALTHLRDAGVAVGCNTQVGGRNLGDLPALTDLIIELGVYGWQVQLMVPMGRAADHEDLWLQPHAMLELLPRVAAARARCDAAGVALWPGDNVGYFGPFEHVIRAGRSRSGHCGGCGGGVVALGLEANGDVKPCSALSGPAYIAGNVRDHSLRALWDTAPELALARSLEGAALWGYCAACYYADICRGGCPWTASTVLGRHGNNPLCHHRALELLSAGRRERLVRRADAPGGVRDRAVLELVEEAAPPEWSETMRELTERAVAALAP